MAQEFRARTLTYKKCRYVERDGQLSTLLLAAVKQHQRAGSRLQRIPPDDKGVRLINHCRRLSGGTICGTLIEFTHGNHQPIVEVADNVDELDVRQLAPPSESAEFLDGLLFFLVSHNHVVLSASKGLRSRQLEEHFDWFLREHAQVLHKQAIIALVDEPQLATRERFKGVKSVKITPDYIETDGARLTRGDERKLRVSPRGRLMNGLLELLEAAGTPLPRGLNFERALAEKRLSATIEVSYRGHVPEDGVPLLDSLAEALRNADDVGYQLHVPGIGKVSGGELRLTHNVRVPVYDGMPDLPELFRQMHGWLESLVATGQVREHA